MVKVAGFLITVMLLFSQCNNFTGSADARHGHVMVSFSPVITSISPAVMDYDDYEFTFYRESDNSPTVFHKKKGDHFIFTLDKGAVYILEAKAYKKSVIGENLSAEGVSGFFKVDTATIVELKLNAMPGEGPGTFSCFIEYPVGATIEELILEIDDSSEMDLTANADIVSGKISSSVDLESGLYFLILRLSMDGKEASYSNGVEIYSGQSTNFGTTGAPVVLTNDDFKSTSATGGKYIALTYDDVGPGDYEDTTESCLHMLDAENVKATFFVQGTIHSKVEPTIQYMYDNGYEIGNHAETHKSLYTYNVLKQEIENTDARIGQILNITNYKTTYFRPPYDNQSFDSKGNSVVEAAARDLGKPVIMWDLSTYDFVEGITVPDIYEIIVSCAATNASEIILLHIQNYQAIVAVYFAINYLKNQGYEFLTVSQYLAREGLTPVAGQVVGSQRN